jgi:hypothetical protein
LQPCADVARRICCCWMHMHPSLLGGTLCASSAYIGGGPLESAQLSALPLPCLHSLYMHGWRPLRTSSAISFAFTPCTWTASADPPARQ